MEKTICQTSLKIFLSIQRISNGVTRYMVPFLSEQGPEWNNIKNLLIFKLCDNQREFSELHRSKNLQNYFKSLLIIFTAVDQRTMVYRLCLKPISISVFVVFVPCNSVSQRSLYHEWKKSHELILFYHCLKNYSFVTLHQQKGSFKQQGFHGFFRNWLPIHRSR